MNRLTALARRKPGDVMRGLAPLWAILAALLLGGMLIAATGVNPLVAYRSLLRGAFGNANSLGDTLIKATTLIFAGAGMAFAFRCGVFNIGGEGQIYVGALFATWIGLMRLPPIVHLPLALIAGFVGGGLWAAIAGWLRARRGLNEIIVTIFMNYIAVILVSFFVTGSLKEPPGYYPQTAEVAKAAQLPVILPGSRLHAGLFLALASAAVIWLVLRRTSLGFQVRAVGANPTAARHAGINVERNIVLAMFISGGLAGWAGTVEVLGVQHRLRDFFLVGAGYDAIAVALLGGSDPLGAIPAALFFGTLRTGAGAMQRGSGVPTALVVLVQGLAVIFVLIGTVLRARPQLFRFKGDNFRDHLGRIGRTIRQRRVP